jgi:predicted HD phosphohydrolase
LHQKASDAPKAGEDDLHQYFVLPFLRATFPDAVLEPIRLHVEAKRCLSAIDPTYHSRLSPVSVHSLELQGGVHSADEALRFQALPFADDALRLRRWDDRAKIPGVSTPGLDHFFAVVQSVHARHAAAATGHPNA